MSDQVLITVILGAIIANFWLGWSLCTSYHRRRARRRRRRPPPPAPAPASAPAMRPSRPAGATSIASTYVDGGTRKRTLVARHDKELENQ